MCLLVPRRFRNISCSSTENNDVRIRKGEQIAILLFAFLVPVLSVDEPCMLTSCLMQVHASNMKRTHSIKRRSLDDPLKILVVYDSSLTVLETTTIAYIKVNCHCTISYFQTRNMKKKKSVTTHNLFIKKLCIRTNPNIIHINIHNMIASLQQRITGMGY